MFSGCGANVRARVGLLFSNMKTKTNQLVAILTKDSYDPINAVSLKKRDSGYRQSRQSVPVIEVADGAQFALKKIIYLLTNRCNYRLRNNGRYKNRYFYKENVLFVVRLDLNTKTENKKNSLPMTFK